MALLNLIRLGRLILERARWRGISIESVFSLRRTMPASFAPCNPGLNSAFFILITPLGACPHRRGSWHLGCIRLAEGGCTADHLAINGGATFWMDHAPVTSVY